MIDIKKFYYAKQYLNEKGIKIFDGKKQILEYEEDYYPKEELKTSIIPSKNFIESEDKEYFIKISYKALKERFGYGILSEDVGKRFWRKGQSVVWRLVKIKNNPNILPDGSTRSSSIKKQVEFRYYPLLRAIRAIGEKFVDEDGMPIGLGGETGFIFLDKKYDKQKIFWTRTNFYKKKMGIEIKEDIIERERVVIPEIPFMFTEDNCLLTLDKKRDMQTILYIGARGKGKSFGMNACLTRLKNIWKDKVGIIDPLGIFSHISLPATDFLRDLKRIGEQAMPSPAIHLKMSSPNLEIDNDITFRLLNNFRDFLSRYKFFTYGIQKYDLGKAEKYMNTVLKDKRKIKDSNDFKQMMFEIIQNSDDKGIQAMIFKWVNAIESVFKEEFTDNLFDESSEWKMESEKRNLKSNPFNIALYSGLLAVLNLNDVKRMPTFRNRFADVIQNFITFQSRFKERTWLCFDEMGEFYEQRRRRDNCSEIVEELFRQSRNLSLGIIGNSQPYSSLHDDIKKNTSILFCTLIRQDKERKEIARDYQLDKEEQERLGQLNTFEFMAMSKDPFVYYDSFGKRHSEKRTFVGKMIPPVTKHLQPR